MAGAEPPAVPKPRVIRVFVSSTFRDMRDEREELVKRVFPQLRKLCEARGVAFADVDLRWGIPDERKAEGKVLPICLEEIRRCRPFFLGLLGERYGWVPEHIPDDLVAQQPWLAEHRERSVTELEILHGVLNDPAMANRACFYFRDLAYIERVPAAQRADFVEEDPAKRAKLAALKQRVRKSGLAIEGYRDPQHLGELVLHNLTVAINQEFPPEEVPGPLDRDAADHEAFAQSRTGVYIGRSEYFARLDAHAAGDGPPLVILGESGGGKSALLANWAFRHRAAHPDDLVLMHFIGSSPYSSDWAAMLRRILGEFNRRLGLKIEIPDKPDALRATFANALHIAAARVSGGTGVLPVSDGDVAQPPSAVSSSSVAQASPPHDDGQRGAETPRPQSGRRIILILDALNQLEDRDGAPDLVWLPPVIPAPVRLILSTLPGRPLDDLRKRNWPTLTIEPLNPNERSERIARYLGQYTKALSPALAEQIAAAPRAANPLYIRALLEELRVFGSHEQLADRIHHYLAAHTIPELYERILERYEGDYERDRPGLVRDSMTALWAARRGLSEPELLELLGTDGHPLPRVHWSGFAIPADHCFITRSGLLTFAHDYLREAVQLRYLAGGQDQEVAHCRIADYFSHLRQSVRQLEELPWQLQHSGQWARLRDCLAGVPMFTALCKRDSYELLGYWLAIGDRSDMVAAYRDSLASWQQEQRDSLEQSVVLILLAGFFRDAGRLSHAEPLYRQAVAIRARAFGEAHPETAAVLNELAELLRLRKDYPAAEPLYRRALAASEQTLGPKHPQTAGILNNLAALLWTMGDDSRAEPLCRRVLAIWEEALGPGDPRLAATMHNLAWILKEKGDYAGGEHLCRRALAIDQEALGVEHPEVATDLSALAAILEGDGDHATAERLRRQALAIREKTLGADHPLVAVSLTGLAKLLEETGQSADLEALHRRALAIREKALGPEHPDVAQSLNNLAFSLDVKGDFAGAEKLYRRALAIWEKTLGPEHPDVATALENLAQLLQDKGEPSEAEQLHRRALAIQEKEDIG